MNGYLGLWNTLTIVFVVLKLCHVIAWSWWWVISPSLFFLGVIWALFILLILFSFLKIMAKTFEGSR
jgi:hypothetical protein